VATQNFLSQKSKAQQKRPARQSALTYRNGRWLPTWPGRRAAENRLCWKEKVIARNSQKEVLLVPRSSAIKGGSTLEGSEGHVTVLGGRVEQSRRTSRRSLAPTSRKEPTKKDSGSGELGKGGMLDVDVRYSVPIEPTPSVQQCRLPGERFVHPKRSGKRVHSGVQHLGEA